MVVISFEGVGTVICIVVFLIIVVFPRISIFLMICFLFTLVPLF